MENLKIAQRNRNDWHRVAAVLLFLIALVIQTGCAVKFVSSYDEQTDKAVTALQRKVETFLVLSQFKAGSPDWTYEKTKNFYNDIAVDLSAIRVRAEAIDKNELTIKQLGLVQDNFDKMEQLQKSGQFSGPVIESLRNSLNSQFTAILKLELAKKRQ